MLAAGDVPAAQASWGVNLLLQFATATAAEHATEQPAAPRDWEALGRTLAATSSTTHPHIVALGDDLLSGEPERLRGDSRCS